MKKTFLIIDIGTTTIASKMIDAAGIQPPRQFSMRNSQRKYGADVITRARAAMMGKAAQLQQLMLDDIARCIAEYGTAPTDLMIAGNPVMMCLLHGVDVSPLVNNPFDAQHVNYPLESEILGYPARSLPYLSAFFGGDALASLCCAQTLQTAAKAPFLMIDFGTNCEIAFYDGSEMICSSAAAGPVFEGGHISCGTAAMPGAVDRVTLQAGDLRFTTISAAPPIGICGSGLVDLIAALVKLNIIDTSGKMALDYYFAPGLSLTPKDVREFQVGKAAVCAAIETLCKNTRPQTVYLCGKMGENLSVENAVAIGMLPAWIQTCSVMPITDSVLQGALLYDAQKEILQSCRAVSLDGNADFDDLFIDCMGF